MHTLAPIVFILLCLSPVNAVAALPLTVTAVMSAEELEQWFNEDEPEPPVQVEQGELTFLSTPPEKPVLHASNRITISKDSIDTGWVSLSQCYRNLDPVDKTDVVYQYRFMRELTVSSTRNIDQARVNGQAVELIGIEKNAELCVTAEVRVFYQNPDGSFSLVNGPYFRKFLDGYFPYHVTMQVMYPAQLLDLVKTSPASQAGFSVTIKTDGETGKLDIDTWFAGELFLEMIFRLRPSA